MANASNLNHDIGFTMQQLDDICNPSNIQKIL